MTDFDLIAEGRTLLDAATSAPWFVRDNDLIGGTCVTNVDAPPFELNPSAMVADMLCGTGDAELIVWMRNALPLLLDELEGAQILLGRLTQAVEADYTAIAAKQRRDAARIEELEAALPYCEVWSDEVPPGGMVCGTCGQPVESEPCPDHAPTSELQTARDLIATKLRDHRGGSTRHIGTGMYKNPARQGYDQGLTEALAALGVDATETHYA